LPKIFKLTFAFRHAKRRRHVHNGNVVVQPTLLAGSVISAACVSIVTLTFWIKFVTQKLV